MTKVTIPDMSICIPCHGEPTIEMVHEIEKAADEAFIKLGYKRTGTKHDNGVTIEFYQLGKCICNG